MANCSHQIVDENHNIKKFMIKKNMSETTIVALAVLLVSKLNLHVVVFIFFSPKGAVEILIMGLKVNQEIFSQSKNSESK